MTNSTENTNEDYNKLKNKVDFLDYCVGLLSPDNKETIECLYYKGYTFRDFARAKMLTKSGAEGRQKRAIRELMKYYCA